VQANDEKISPWVDAVADAAQTGVGRKRLFITLRSFNSPERAQVRAEGQV